MQGDLLSKLNYTRVIQNYRYICIHPLQFREKKVSGRALDRALWSAHAQHNAQLCAMRQTCPLCSCFLFACACTSRWLTLAALALLCSAQSSPLLSSSAMSAAAAPSNMDKLRNGWFSEVNDQWPGKNTEHNNAAEPRLCARLRGLCAAPRGRTMRRVFDDALFAAFPLFPRYRSVSRVHQDSVPGEVGVPGTTTQHTRYAQQPPRRPMHARSFFSLSCSSHFSFSPSLSPSSRRTDDSTWLLTRVSELKPV